MRQGSKYDPLKVHLTRCGEARIVLSIADIEDLLGFELCSSSAAPSWWANTKSDAGRAQRRAWRQAGYDAFLAPDGEAVEFTRSADSASKREKAPRRGAFADGARRRST